MHGSMSQRPKRVSWAAGVVALFAALTLAAPGGAQAAQVATEVQILAYDYQEGVYSLASGRLETSKKCRAGRTVKYLLDQEGDGSFRVADTGRSTANGAWGLIAALDGDPSLGALKIKVEPKRVGKTRCAGDVTLGD